VNSAWRVIAGLIFVSVGVRVASAQTPFNFSLLLSTNGQVFTIPNNEQIALTALVGAKSQATVMATYTGTTQATISTAPGTWLLGSTEFTVALVNATVPIVLTPQQSFSFSITYAPTNANQAGAEISIPYTEQATTPSGTPINNSIAFPLLGQTPSFSLFYVLQTNNDSVAIPSGGTIPFGATQINTSASANLDIFNNGSGAGVITGITQPPASSPFKVEGIPPIPSGSGYTVAPGTLLALVVQYTPTGVETDTAQITITYQGGTTATVNLSGNGITSAFTYKYLVGGASTTVGPNGTITFPGANVGSTSSLIVQVTNTGSATGTINSVSTSNPPNGGATFTLTNPITLPATLTAGNSFSVPLTFTPLQAGTQTGGLLIGNDFFTLSGQGQGSNLTYSYASGGVTTPVNPATGGAVLFSSVPVGQSEQVLFTVTNSGTLPATISLVGTTPTGGPFTVSGTPKTLAPNSSLPLTITFTPTVTGISSGTLLVNTTSIQLIGNASAPNALPSYTISGPSGTVSPATQANVSLTLSKGYGVDLTGTLTLTTQGSLGSDQTVQFSTGGRTVDFVIPANTTEADFAGEGTQIGVQTGTVAETVTLTPTFTTSGGVDVTPNSPSTLQFTIPSLAPFLVGATISNESSTGFELVLVGYTTTRSLSSLSVTFNAASGFTIGTSQLTIDLSQSSPVWFQSSASLAVGGEFQITQPFTLQGTLANGQTPLQAIASVTATVSNSVGASLPVQANLQ
jgi:hypothetical protein